MGAASNVAQYPKDGDFGVYVTEAEDRFETDAGRHYRIRCKLSAESWQGLRQDRGGNWRQPETNLLEQQSNIYSRGLGPRVQCSAIQGSGLWELGRLFFFLYSE